ncbi:BA14K family protein [Alsobacter soli]|nr:BA14K family protein [Alsobacter soli]
MSNGAKIIVQIVRTLGLLVFMATCIGVGYLALVTHFPSSEGPTADAGKIGPVLTQPRPAPIVPVKTEPAPRQDAPATQAAAIPAQPAPGPAAVPAPPAQAAAAAPPEPAPVIPAAPAAPSRRAWMAADAAELETGALAPSAGTPRLEELTPRQRKRLRRAALAQEAGPARRYAPGSAGCEHYRSFDPVSQTYRSFDGRIRECRVQSASR